MKYFSLDIETTGLDPYNDQILQVAMVLEDTDHPDVPVEELPYISFNVKHDRYAGSAFALSLNAKILSDLAAGFPSIRATSVDDHIRYWLTEELGINLAKDRLNIAGKNAAGFDIPFLSQIAPDVCSKFRHKVIDPGSVFVDWTKNSLPGLGDLTGGAVAHTAYEDALDVIRVLRRSYPGSLEDLRALYEI